MRHRRPMSPYWVREAQTPQLPPPRLVCADQNTVGEKGGVLLTWHLCYALWHEK